MIYAAPFVSSLLFVGISLVSATVPVDVGSVNVPVLLISEITGVVSVLFVRVSAPVNVATVESIANDT